MMEDLFVYDNVERKVKLNGYAILLVKEFKALWDQARNKCKEDPTGIHRVRAYKEFTYIFLYLDWKSPYFQYLEKDRHEAALEDSGMDEKDLSDESFKAAFTKYREILDSDRVLSLIRTALKTLTKTQVFLDGIDFVNDVDDQGRLLYKPSEVMKDLTQIKVMEESLRQLEIKHKTQVQESAGTRGGVEKGFMEE